MITLDPAQCELFREQGYLLIENAVDEDLLAQLRRDFDTWVEESRQHTEPHGPYHVRAWNRSRRINQLGRSPGIGLPACGSKRSSGAVRSRACTGRSTLSSSGTSR